MKDESDVTSGDYAVASADTADARINAAVPQILKLLRLHLSMDVAFVSEFVGGRRVFRNVDTARGARVFEEGDSHPLERTFCKMIMDGRLPAMVSDYRQHPLTSKLPPAPFPIGAYLSVAVVLDDGTMYGTLCCFSFEAKESLRNIDLEKLQMAAQLISRRIEEARARQPDRQS